MKRTRADSAESAVKAMVDAAKGDLHPPAHVKLRERDLPFWLGVVRARARDEWTEADLVVASQLAKCQSDIEVEQETLDGESTVVTNDRGTACVNPRVAVLEQYARREMALMRTLRMGGRVAGDASKELARRKVLSGAKQARQELEEEDFLAS
jgi:hypothetical protein